MEVKRLFFNTPARKKFLKSPATEMGHIVQEVLEHALAAPGVAFRLLSAGTVVWDLPPAASLRDRVMEIFGGDNAYRLIAVERREGDVSVHGFILPPEQSASRRKGFSLFVNRRPVGDRMVFIAVREGYGSRLPAGRYPGGALFLDLERGSVDVNIHPTKKEVKFQNPSLIRRAVVAAVRDALNTARPLTSFFRPGEVPPPGFVGEKAPAYRLSQAELEMAVSLARQGEGIGAAASGFVVVGQVKNSYAVVETPEGLLLIDQHAAHERILFERFENSLKREKLEIQELLAPLHLELGPREAALLSEKIELLRDLGIGVETFGGDSFIVTSVPALLSGREKEELVLEVLGDIADWEKDPDDPRREVIIRMACAAAVKARTWFPGAGLQRLVDDLFRCQDPTVCPHGRPAVLKFSWEELERRFGRR